MLQHPVGWKEPDSQPDTTAQAKRLAPEVVRGDLVGNEAISTEALIGLVGGIAYGMTSPMVGHPFDTVKTKMQAEPAHRRCSALGVARSIYRTQGFSGFYRGLLPNLMGSAVLGGLCLSSYNSSFCICRGTILEKELPFTGGLRGSVLVGGFAAALTRCVVETPLALVKVRQQVGRPWIISGSQGGLGKLSFLQFRELYKGITATFFRSWGMLGTFFILHDYCVRNLPDLVNAPLAGPFLKGGVCATAGWIVAWPMETVKSKIQADTSVVTKELSTFKLLGEIMRKEGVRGIYRGIGPGATRSFVANGAAMVACNLTQERSRGCKL